MNDQTNRKDNAGPIDAAKVIRESHKAMLVGFDTTRVLNYFRDMAAMGSVEADAKQAAANAGVGLVTEAYRVAAETRAAGGIPSDSEWSANIKAVLPVLAAEGSTLVKVATSDKGTKYTLTGYGANVNSVARGFVQYDDITPDDALNEAGDVTFSGLRTVVQERRKRERSPEQVALDAAREMLSESIKALRAEVGTNDRAMLEAAAQLVDELTATFRNVRADVAVIESPADDDTVETTDDADKAEAA